MRDFAIIGHFGTVLCFLIFVLVSGLQRERGVQYFITRGKKRCRSEVLVAAFQDCVLLTFKSRRRCELRAADTRLDKTVFNVHWMVFGL